MRTVAVLSGKGGAGKTFVAVNLAAAAGRATYIDCDVEEPNGRLFWKPENVEAAAVTTLLPAFDASRCTGCRKCVSFCRLPAGYAAYGDPLPHLPEAVRGGHRGHRRKVIRLTA